MDETRGPKWSTLIPGRRFLVVDPGRRCVKVLLVSLSFGRLQVLQHRVIDMVEGRPLTEDEVDLAMEEVFQGIGNYPLAMALPQRLALSQVIDLPAADKGQVRDAIEEETRRLAGLSDSSIVYDYGRLEGLEGGYNNPFWVTIARESEVLEEVNRIAGLGGRLFEITTGANALIAAYQSLTEAPENVCLVDLGAQCTVMAIVVQREGVYATSFPIGSDQFTEAIAVQRNSSLIDAENDKSAQNLLTGPDAVGGLVRVVEGWRAEVLRVMEDWLREHAHLRLSPDSFRMILGGGGSLQPGFFEHLSEQGGPEFARWSRYDSNRGEFLERHAISYGTALKCLVQTPPSASLFPKDLRIARQRRQTQEFTQKVVLLFLAGVAGLLILGTWQLRTLRGEKAQKLADANRVLQAMREIDEVQRELATEYEEIRPVLVGQQRTVGALRTLKAIRETTIENELWYVLFADQWTYYSPRTRPWASPEATAAAAAAGEANGFSAPLSRTNLLMQKRGFVAELSVPEQGEPTRSILSRLVSKLKTENPFFQNVDLLPMDRTRDLADPKVTLPGRTFALSFELPENEFLRESPSLVTRWIQLEKPKTSAPPRAVEPAQPAPAAEPPAEAPKPAGAENGGERPPAAAEQKN